MLLLFAAVSFVFFALGPTSRAETAEDTNYVGLLTNGPAVFALHRYLQTNVTRNLLYNPNPLPFDTNRVPASVVEKLLERRRYEFTTNVELRTNPVFQSFTPGSLQNLAWTNTLASTNGRNIVLWSIRQHPADWPTNPPIVKWNHESVAWGMKGLTALSPCWEQEGSSGQVPITALTRRHGYTRGHGMGPDGFRTQYAGKKVWFLAADDTLVEARIAREVVRTVPSGKGDYTIVLFKRDLPTSIQPLRVISTNDFFSKYKDRPGAPLLMFCTEQWGNISVGLPGLTAPIIKGGDSGSPNLLPLPGELIFEGGRATASPSPGMQADMDELCRLEGLDPKRYQMQWVDVSKYPSY